MLAYYDNMYKYYLS